MTVLSDALRMAYFDHMITLYNEEEKAINARKLNTYGHKPNSYGFKILEVYERRAVEKYNHYVSMVHKIYPDGLQSLRENPSSLTFKRMDYYNYEGLNKTAWECQGEGYNIINLTNYLFTAIIDMVENDVEYVMIENNPALMLIAYRIEDGPMQGNPEAQTMTSTEWLAAMQEIYRSLK